MPLINGESLKRLMDQKGFDARRFANVTELSERTIRNALSGENVRSSTLSVIAEGLDVSPASILLHADPILEASPRFTRDIAGIWYGSGCDLELPGHFEYEIPPVHYEVEMSLQQDGTEFSGTGWLLGQAGTRQPIELWGTLHEDGNYLLLNWRNADPAVNDYGIGAFEYTADGKSLAGYFVGRERIHSECGLMFGRIEARRRKT